MAICAKCGTDSAGQFCVSCGAPLAAAAPAVAPASTPASTQAPASDLPENAACMLCYVMWALSGVVFLVLEPYSKSKLVRFHAWQSIAVSVLMFIGWFVVLVVAAILRLLPVIGGLIASLIFGVYGLAMTGLWLLLMIKAYQGGSLDLPYISKFAQKQA